MKEKIVSILLMISFAFALEFKEVHQVIIIGAGISGLRASQILSQSQIPHLILQSSDHIGGRITSMDFQGVKVDKGASFIHNSKKDNSLGKIIDQLGWPSINGTCSYRVMYFQQQKQSSVSLLQIIQARKMYFKLVQNIQTKLQNSKDVSVYQITQNLFSQTFPQQSFLKNRLVDFMFQIQGNIDGAQTSQISAKMRSYKESQVDLMPATGFHQLLKIIFNFIGGKILFNKRVYSIDYSSNLIKIQTDKDTFFAKKVISSLPLGLLKAQKVNFIPQLPLAYRQSIQNIGFGFADKLYASFKKPFWGNKTGWLSFVTKYRLSHFPVAFIVPSPDKFLLIFFVSGNQSIKISEWNNQKIIDYLQDFLILFFKICQIQIKSVKLTRWHMDENSLGSYSNYKVGTEQKDFIQISKPINDKLWFIGQHTHPKLNSYAHGAYMSGELAGHQVVSSLKNYQQNLKTKFFAQSTSRRFFNANNSVGLSK